MALPSSGTITAAMINVELGRVAGAAFSLNGTAERTLAGKPTGAISFSDFLGKSATPKVLFVDDNMHAYSYAETVDGLLQFDNSGVCYFWDAGNDGETSRFLPTGVSAAQNLYEIKLSAPTNLAINVSTGNVVAAWDVWYTLDQTKNAASLTTVSAGTAIGSCTLSLREKASTANLDTVILTLSYTE